MPGDRRRHPRLPRGRTVRQANPYRRGWPHVGQAAGRTHQVFDWRLADLSQRRINKTFSVITNVTFLPLSKEQIDEYLAGIDPLDKAGGYAIQQDKHKIIKRVSGSVSNVVGLPVERLKEELNHLFSEKIEEQW